MKNLVSTTIFTIIALLLASCGTQQSWQKVLMENPDEIDKRLVNYALSENGTVILVSEDNPNHPVSTLNNGIISSEDWDNGEGWESHFDGRYDLGRYFEYGSNAWAAAMAFEARERERMLSGDRSTRTQVNPEDFEEEDDNWRGLRGNSAFGGRIYSSMGWVVFEFPEEKLVNRVIVYTIDSEKYPAKKYGVNHLRLQYWTPQAKGWQNVERFGKGKGQQFDSIRDIRTGKITFRFKPVRTSKIRLVILWTNDSKRYKFGYFRYARGTIRLVEVEIYGTESKEEAGAIASADELELSQLLEETKTDESSERVPTLEDVQTNAVEATIRSYERAYRNKDLKNLMSTISAEYFRDGETYQQLESKMQNLFHGYEDIDFTLQGLRVERTEQDAEVEANYYLKLYSDGVQDSAYSGKLFFNLSNTNGMWKITQISTKRW
ncbi:TPA: hypothetical protein EYP66_20865 [Candidatus Poribacteria bacterium]|nr:hypothetical protein [Candidatus Poribacteria bacterium]